MWCLKTEVTLIGNDYFVKRLFTTLQKNFCSVGQSDAMKATPLAVVVYMIDSDDCLIRCLCELCIATAKRLERSNSCFRFVAAANNC